MACAQEYSEILTQTGEIKYVILNTTLVHYKVSETKIFFRGVGPNKLFLKDNQNTFLKYMTDNALISVHLPET